MVTTMYNNHVYWIGQKGIDVTAKEENVKHGMRRKMNDDLCSRVPQKFFSLAARGNLSGECEPETDE